MAKLRNNSRRAKFLPLLPTGVLLAAITTLLLAGVTPGPQFQVNTFTPGAQVGPAMGMNAAGTSVIAWTSVGQDGDGQGVFAQRFDSSGARAGLEFQVNTTTAGDQGNPAVAMDTAGNFVIVWQGAGTGDSFGIFAQRFDASGNRVGTEFQVNTTTAGDQRNPDVAMDAVGNFVVTWDDSHAICTGCGIFLGSEIFAQRFDFSGNRVGTEFQVNTTTSGARQNPSAGMDSAADFVVAWEDGNQIFAQRYDPSGNRAGTEFPVHTTIGSTLSNPSVGMDAAGNFVIATMGPGILGRRFNSTGTPQGNDFQVSISGERPAVGMAATGNFVVAWNQLDPNDTEGIFAQCYDAAGAPQGSTFQVNALSDATQRFATVRVDAAGNFVVAWEHGSGGIDTDVFARRFTAPSVPALTINDVSVVKGNSGTTNATFTVTLSVASSQTVTVQFATADGSATVAENDYVANSGTLTFAPGETTKPITVLVNGDTRPETPETFFVNLNSPSNATIARAQGVGTIVSNVPLPSLSINDVTLPHGTSGTTPAVFSVTLSPPSIETVSVIFSTADGTASVADKDYVFNSGTLTFSPGETTKQITILINGDPIPEADETFSVNLTNPINAIIAKAQGVGTLLNDKPITPGTQFPVSTFPLDQFDAAVGMNAAGSSVIAWVSKQLDGTTGVFAQRFDAGGNRVGVEFRVDDPAFQPFSTSTRRRPAVAMDTFGNFVIVWAGGTVFLDSFTNSKIFAQRFSSSGIPQGSNFLVNGNVTNSFNEEQPAIGMLPGGDFVVAWGDTSRQDVFAERLDANGIPQGPAFLVNTFTTGFQGNPAVAASSATVSSLPSVSPTNRFVIVWQGAGPGTTAGIFAQVYENGLTQGSQFQVDASTSGAPANPAAAMDALGRFVVVWEQGNGNGVFAHSFNCNPPPQPIGFSCTFPPPGSGFQVNSNTSVGSNPTVAMGASGKFVVAWVGQGATTSVIFARPFDSSGTPQTPEFQVNDFLLFTASPAAGMDGAGNFVVAWNGQSVGRNVSSVFARRFAAGAGVPSLSVNDVSVTQGNSGTTNAAFTVTLSAASNRTVTVDFSTADGTATVADNDYVANSGTLTFNPGDTSKQIAVLVNGDTAPEPDETFFVNLGNATNATIAKAQGVGTIQNHNAVQIVVNESITVTDAPSVLPSAMIGVAENITVTDVPALQPSAMIGVAENIVVTDAPSVQPSAMIGVAENIMVQDATQVFPLDFNLGAIAPLTITAGTSASTAVIVNPVNGFSSDVKLSVSGQPAGVTASLSVNPVTPSGGNPASSVLNVSLPSFIAPSNFTLTVTGASGSLNHSTTANITVTATPSSTSNFIGDLLNAGCIDNAGIANALNSKLSAAQAAGNIQTAINTLTALKNQINAQAGKHIATSCTIGGVALNPVTVLLLDVQGLIDSLRVSMTPDPITGYVVDRNGVGVPGAAVSILDANGNAVATATTDITGFYFMATTGFLSPSAAYTLQVTGLPVGFSAATPASQPFAWQGSAIAFSNFVLN